MNRFTATFIFLQTQVGKAFFLVIGTCALLAASPNAQAQLAPNYTFSATSGTYTPITVGGGATAVAAVVADDAISNVTGLAAFTVNSVAYTNFNINSNGRLSLYTTTAPTATGTYTPLSSAITNAAVVLAPFGADLGVSTAATTNFLWQTIGNEHIFQWENYSRYSFSGNNDILNFQIRLNTSTGVIRFVYGTCTAGSNPTSSPQVGWRNSTTWTTDISNLQINITGSPNTCDWSNAVPGNANTSSMYLNAANPTVKPNTGLTYTWTPQASPAPVRTFAAVSAITSTGATIGWTAPTGATSYNVRYRVVGDCAWTNASGNPYGTNSAVLTGLCAATKYQVQVQSIGGGNSSMYSYIPSSTAGTGTNNGYVAAGTFTTSASACSAPTALVASGVSQTAATVSWTAPGSAPAGGYQYFYSTSVSPAPGCLTVPTGSTAAGVTNVGLTGLTANTTYYAWVRSNCSGSESAWVGPLSFTTPCVGAAVPFNEGFESGFTNATAVGGCWSQESIAGAQAWTANSALTSYNRTPRTGSFNAFLQYSNTDWMYYPLSLTGGTSYTFDVYARQDGNTPASSILNLGYGTSNTSAAMGANPVIATADITNGAYQLVSGTFTPASTGTYYIGIQSVQNGSPWYTSIDDIAVYATPSCVGPTSLATSGVSTTAATLSWTASVSNPSGGHQYYIATSATPAPVSGTTPTGTVALGTNNASLTGLSAQTTYYAWVRADCGGVKSAWSGPVSFTTPCAAGSVPFAEGFESGFTNNAAVAGCWTQESVQGAEVWQANNTNTTYNRSPRTGAWNATLYYGNEDWLFYGLNLVGGTNYTFDVYARQDGSVLTDSDILLAYGSVASDAGMTNIVAGPVGINATYRLITGTFTPPTTGVYYVGISGFMNGNPWYISIDDIAVYETPACSALPTALTASAITSTTATASWTAASPVPGSGYEYYVSTSATPAPLAGTTPTGSTAAGVTNASLTGLTANTTYYVWVRSNCGTGQSPWVGTPLSFTTACNTISSFPFTETFETTSTTVTCWSNVQVVGSSNWTYATGAGGGSITGAYAGTRNARFVSMSGTNSPITKLVSPTFDLTSLTTPRLNFYYGQEFWSPTQNELAIYYRTAPGNPWVQIGTNYNTSVASWTNLIITLPNPSATYQLAFEGINNWGRANVLDNITIEETPQCAQLPTALTVSSITATTATVSWTAASPAPGSGYEYFLATAATPAPTALTAATGSVAAGVVTVGLTGLTPSTQYYVWVRSNCGSAQSTWVGSSTFLTPCSAVTGFPFTEDFESGSATVGCWRTLTSVGTGAWSYATGAGGGAITAAYSGSVNARFVSTVGSNSPIAKLISPPLDLTSLTTPRLTFYYGQELWSPDQNTTHLFYRISPTDPWVLIADYTTNVAAWTQVSVNLPNPSATYEIAFEGRNNFGRANVIDDVTVAEAPLCSQTPSAIASTAVTTTTATISWAAAAPAPASGYEYYYSISATAPLAGTTASGSTAAGVLTANLTGLTLNTPYYVWVRSNCGGAQSAWVGPHTFTTPCNTISTFPFTETFESASSTRPCWSNLAVAGTGDWTYATGSSGGSITTAYAGTENARFVSVSGTNSPTTKLVSPPFDLTSLTVPQLTFYYGQESWFGDQNTTHVYYRTSSSNPWVLITGANYTSSVAAWTQVTLLLPNPSATYQIAFEGRNNFGYANVLDNVVIDEAPACPQLPTALSVGSISNNSATLSWTAASPVPGAGYDYYVSTSATAPVNGTTPSGNTTSTSAVVSGLSANTPYYAWVRSRCNGTDYSTWVGSANFTTLCNPGSVPFFEGFESGQTNGNPVAGCWSQESPIGAQVWTANNSLTSYNRAPRTGSFNAYLQFSNQDWMFYPLSLVGGTSYTVEAYARQDGSTASDVFFSLAYGTAGNAASMNVIGAVANLTNGNYQLVSRSFVPPTSGTYYIGIRSTINGNPWYVSVDDIRVYLTPSCVAPTGLTLLSSGVGTASIGWTANSPVPSGGYNYYYSTSATAPTGSTIPSGNAGGVSTTLTGLTGGVPYYFWLRADCGGGDISAWTGPFQFYAPPTNDACADAINLPCGTTNLAGTTNGSVVETVSVGCGMSGYGVWYSFVGNGFPTTISVTTSGYDVEVGVARGSCGSLINVACRDFAGATGTETVPAFTTILGTTYYVYIGHYAVGNTSTGNFTISRSCAVDVWSGSVSTAWNVGGNWVDGTVPTVSENAMIPSNPVGGNFPSITNSELISSITLNTGATLEIQSGGALTVNSVMTNLGLVTVQSGASLVQVTGSTLTGSGTYRASRNGSTMYDYWSTPIANVTLGDLGASYIYDPSLGTDDPSDDEHDPGWVLPTGSTMVTAKGYAVHGATTRTFQGTVHNGNIGIGVTSHALPNVSWNLVGNPYPSGISVSQFLTANSSLLAIGAVYLWDDPGVTPYTSGGYATRSLGGGTAGGGGNVPTNTMGSFQGFKVKVNGNGSIQFTNAMRTAGNTSMLFRPAMEQRLWLSVSNTQGGYNQTLVGFLDETTEGVDWGYDAPKLDPVTNLSLYSFIGNEPYAIQFYDPLFPERIVPLGLASGFDTEITFSIDDLENMSDEYIILEDRYLDVFHDLQESSYSFQASSVQYLDRFFLHFMPNQVTGLEDALSSTGLHAYINDGVLNLTMNEDLTGDLSLFDMSGRMVLNSNVVINGQRGKVDVSGLVRGAYIVKVSANGVVATQKVFK